VPPEHSKILLDTVKDNVECLQPSSSNVRTPPRTSTGLTLVHGMTDQHGTSNSMVVIPKTTPQLIHTLLTTEDSGLMADTVI
jgi:hypothetical protein